MKSVFLHSNVLLGARDLDKFTTAMFVTFFFLGAWLGYDVFISGDSTLFFYQFFSPEVFVAACGKGWLGPGVLSGELYNFSLSLASTFDCTYFDSNPPVQELGLFAKSQWYLNLSVNALLSGPVLNYADLWPLPALAMGFYASGCFLLLRLFLPNFFSFVGAMLLVWSPLLTSTLLSFRDFSKAPFVVWLVLLLVLLLRSNGYLRSVLIACLIGCLIGVGSGFRSDVAAIMPIAIVALLICFNLEVFKVRCLAVIMLYAAVIFSTLPMSLPDDAGGGWGTIVQQGMSRPFKDRLKLDPPAYELGWMYSDELSLSSIASSERPHRSLWDENESQPRIGFSQAIRYSGEHVSNWIFYFTGDVLTQALKSAYWVMTLSSIIGEGEDMRTGLLLYPSQLLYKFYGLLNSIFIALISTLGLIALFMRSSILRSSETLGLLVIFAGLLAMPSLQFSLRHIFHLEFLSILGSLSLIFAFTNLNIFMKLRASFWYVFIAISTIILLTYYSAREYQNDSLKRLFTDLLDLPKFEVLGQVNNNGDTVTFSVDVPKQYLSLIESNADSMTSDIVRYGNQWDVRAEADRLMLTINGCPNGEYFVRTLYELKENAWQDFSSEIKVIIVEREEARGHSTEQATRVLLPAFYRPTQYLSEISISPAPSSCVFSLEKFSSGVPFPYLMTGVFSPDWNRQNLFYGIGKF